MKNLKRFTFIIPPLSKRIRKKTLKIRFVFYVFIAVLFPYFNPIAASSDKSEEIALAYIAFDISAIPQSYDLSQGDFLKIKMICKNRGSMAVAPEVYLKIKQEEVNVYSAIFPYPENQPKIQPFSTAEIDTISIPTGNLETGKYRAILRISEGNAYFVDKEFNFSIGKVKSQSVATSNVYSPYNNFWSISRIASALVLLFFLLFLAEPYLTGKKPH